MRKFFNIAVCIFIALINSNIYALKVNSEIKIIEYKEHEIGDFWVFEGDNLRCLTFKDPNETTRTIEGCLDIRNPDRGDI